MTIALPFSFAILWSTLCLGLALISDPKRHRALGPRISLSITQRRIVGFASLLPFIVLVVMNLIAPLFLWCGAITIAGWILTLTPQRS